MKKLLFLVAIIATAFVSSCDKFDDSEIWNKLENHENRISALEELCKQLNTNINALQTIVNALEKNDYITNVSPIRKDGDIIGYTITFAHSDTITIYNGADGKDGADGYTPQIGVMKDTDGIYYWTVDGEWLLDAKGNKIKAVGQDGKDGQDGVDGEDGKDAITPRIKIENDYWYVSYDEGATWTELGKAIGEDGSDGIDGDSIFSDVTQDEEFVYFHLSDGQSLVLRKQNSDYIQFEDIKVKVICCKNWDTNNDYQLSYSEAAAVTDIGTVFSKNKEIVYFDELKYFTSITKIPSEAFMECTSLCIISLPDGITQIEDSAFRNCQSLYSIKIPKSITSIGLCAFYNNLSISRRVYISDIVAWCNVQFSGWDSNPLLGGGELYINDELVTDLIIPNEVKSIPAYAFYSCDIIKSVTFGNQIEAIGDQAFSDCDGLVDITIENGIIGKEVFYECDNLRSVTLGNVTINWRAFACKKLSTVYCKSITPPDTILDDYYGWEAFTFAPDYLKIYVPQDSVDEYKYTDGWKEYKNKIYGYDY